MAETKKTKKSSGQQIKLRQIVSGRAKGIKQQKTLLGLGLGRINKTSVLEDTPSVRGMINKVSHLIVVE